MPSRAPARKTVKLTVTDNDGATTKKTQATIDVTDVEHRARGRRSTGGRTRRCATCRSSSTPKPRGRRGRRDRRGTTGTSTATAASRPTAAPPAEEPHVHDHGRPRGRRARRGQPRADRHEVAPRSTSSTPRRWRSISGPRRARPRRDRDLHGRLHGRRLDRRPAHGTSTTTASSTTARVQTAQLTAPGTTGYRKILRLKRHRQRGRDRDRYEADHGPHRRPDRDLRPGAAAPARRRDRHRRHDHRPDHGRDHDHDPVRPGRRVPEPLHAAGPQRADPQGGGCDRVEPGARTSRDGRWHGALPDDRHGRRRDLDRAPRLRGGRHS